MLVICPKCKKVQHTYDRDKTFKCKWCEIQKEMKKVEQYEQKSRLEKEVLRTS